MAPFDKKCTRAARPSSLTTNSSPFQAPGETPAARKLRIINHLELTYCGRVKIPLSTLQQLSSLWSEAGL